MSLRKFMHEKNIYKKEPNFKQLAIKYPEFRKIAISDIVGKVRINFKDEESLQVLTKTLLKHDFDLGVEIPPKKLVPALPLRLNYILWIEDLLKHSGFDDLSSVHGIDIGTGAIGIYPLLFSKMYKSKMTCTDIDPESINSARKNIERNNLQALIKVILVNKETILKDVLKENERYTFVMCNPPFFETDKGLGKKSKQEPPRNAPTGNENELEVKGGEREFILRLIEESLMYKDKITIYTTMFGQKSSLGFLRTELTKKGILNTTWTEFCQGFTKRWGITWTFASKDEIDLTTAPVIRTRAEVQKMKKQKSMEIVFPPTKSLSCLQKVADMLRMWLTELNIKIKEIELDDDEYPCWACKLVAYADTWSHARRKRRMAMREEASKKQCTENSGMEKKDEKLENSDSENDKVETGEGGSDTTGNTEPLLVCTLLVGEKDENNESEASGSEDSEKEKKNENDKKMLMICMFYDSGHGGKLSLETLRQYLVNKLNIREIFRKQNPGKSNKKKKKKKSKKETN